MIAEGWGLSFGVIWFSFYRKMAESLDDERRPLLSRTTDHSTSPPTPPPPPSPTDDAVESPGCCRLKNCFCFEPILIVLILTIYPMSIVSSLYVLDWFAANSFEPFVGQNTSHATPNASISQCQRNTSGAAGGGDQQSAQSRASQFALYESLLDGIPSFFATILLALGSDRLGRRFAIVPPMVGIFVKILIFTAVVLTNSSIYWFLLGDFIGGCSGSIHSITVACLAFVADRTPSDRRMFRMLVIDLCLMVPTVVAPIVNGAVIVKYGYAYPLIFTVALSTLNLIYVVLFFPGNARLSQDHGSISDDGESTISQSQLTPSSLFAMLWKQIRSMFSIFLMKSGSKAADESRSPWRRLKLNLLLIAFLTKNLDSSEGSVMGLFLMNVPLCWDAGIMGIYRSVSTVVSSVGAIVLAPSLKFCSVPDSVIALMSSLAHVATNVYMLFVKNTVMMFLSESILSVIQ